MNIDNTGISSLDAGASDITYSGNEGPKSPQEEQQMMMAQLEQEYEQYKIQQMEIDPSKVLSFEEWYQATYEASRQGVANGGIMRTGFANGRWADPGMSPGTRQDYSPGQGHRDDPRGGEGPPSILNPPREDRAEEIPNVLLQEGQEGYDAKANIDLLKKLKIYQTLTQALLSCL